MPGLLSHAQTVTKLPAQDLGRPRAFYRDKLGLEPVEERTGGLRYVCGPTEFHLFISSGTPSGESTQMAFEVENLQATLADLRARGVTLERFDTSGFDVRGETIAAPDNYPSKGTGKLGTFFYDSEGNLIGIAQAIPMRARRRGRSFRPNASGRGNRHLLSFRDANVALLNGRPAMRGKKACDPSPRDACSGRAAALGGTGRPYARF
jgi:catechol 2,3-dioxygenase-like lactoylglutathione lyase family enzyme